MFDNIKVFTQNSIRIEDDGKVIYVDTIDMDEAPHDADIICVTHDHFDHFQPESVAMVSGPDTVLVVPENMKKQAAAAGAYVKEILCVAPGGTYEVNGVRFETVPAYNVNKRFHPKSAGWVGYVFDLPCGRVYVAGDTDITDENKKISCDAALVPAGGTYTMTADEAAELVNAIKPKLAIPVHYGSIVGKKADGERFRKLVKAPVEVELRL